MQDPKIQRILGWSIGLGVLLVLAAWPLMGAEHVSGVAAGALVGSLNFWLLARMLERMLEQTESGRGGLAVRFLMKYGMMALLVAGLLFGLRVSPYGFALGVSNFVVAIPLGALGLLRTAGKDDTDEGEGT